MVQSSGLEPKICGGADDIKMICSVDGDQNEGPREMREVGGVRESLKHSTEKQGGTD